MRGVFDGPPPMAGSLREKKFTVLASGYSPRTGLGPSTIAADELNGRVRDGNGCDLIAWDTKTVNSFFSDDQSDGHTYRAYIK